MTTERRPLPPPSRGVGRGPVPEAGSSPARSTNLMRVTVEVAGRRYDEDLADQATVRPDVESVNDALASLPARFSEWAMLEALAKGEVNAISGQINVLQSDIKVLEAQLYLKYVGTGTVDAIKAMVTTADERLALVRRMQDLATAQVAAEENAAKIAVGRKTMEEKRECVIELARNWRQEMQGRLIVNDPKDMGKFKPGGR